MLLHDPNTTMNPVAIDANRVETVNSYESPIEGAKLSKYLRAKLLTLHATTHLHDTYADAEFLTGAASTD